LHSDRNKRRDVRTEIASYKRDQILTVAVTLFLENGYHGTSMENIAEALGVSKPFVYAHFKGKLDILSAISHQGAQLTLSAVADAEGHAGTSWERMARFCYLLADIVIQNRQFLAVYAGETNNLRAADRKDILNLRAEIDRRISLLVQRGAEEGEFEIEDPLLATRAITGMISFVCTWVRDLEAPARDRLAKQMTDIAMRTLRHIKARPGGRS
jgi:AcrR family transcriptional regulator